MVDLFTYPVVQLFEALRCKPEGCEIDSLALGPIQPLTEMSTRVIGAYG